MTGTDAASTVTSSALQGGVVDGAIKDRGKALSDKIAAQVKADFERRKAAGTVGRKVAKRKPRTDLSDQDIDRTIRRPNPRLSPVTLRNLAKERGARLQAYHERLSALDDGALGTLEWQLNAGTRIDFDRTSPIFRDALKEQYVRRVTDAEREDYGGYPEALRRRTPKAAAPLAGAERRDATKAKRADLERRIAALPFALRQEAPELIPPERIANLKAPLGDLEEALAEDERAVVELERRNLVSATESDSQFQG
jgi:hypothetical protein